MLSVWPVVLFAGKPADVGAPWYEQCLCDNEAATMTWLREMCNGRTSCNVKADYTVPEQASSAYTPGNAVTCVSNNDP